MTKNIEKMDCFINELYNSIKNEKDLSKCVYAIAEKTKGIKTELAEYIFSIFPIEKRPLHKNKELLRWAKDFKQKMDNHVLEKKEFKKALQSGESNENKKLMDSMIKKDKLEIVVCDLSKF